MWATEVVARKAVEARAAACEAEEAEEATELMTPKDAAATNSGPFSPGYLLPLARTKVGSKPAASGGLGPTRHGGLPPVIGPEVFDTGSKVLKALHTAYEAQEVALEKHATKLAEAEEVFHK